jgi:hypothetical protein
VGKLGKRVKLWSCEAVIAIMRGVIDLSDGKVDDHII